MNALVSGCTISAVPLLTTCTSTRGASAPHRNPAGIPQTAVAAALAPNTPAAARRDGRDSPDRGAAASWGSIGLGGLGGLESIRFALPSGVAQIPRLALSPGRALVPSVVHAHHEHQPAGQGRLPDLQCLGVLGRGVPLAQPFHAGELDEDHALLDGPAALRNPRPSTADEVTAAVVGDRRRGQLLVTPGLVWIEDLDFGDRVRRHGSILGHGRRWPGPGHDSGARQAVARPRSRFWGTAGGGPAPVTAGCCRARSAGCHR